MPPVTSALQSQAEGDGTPVFPGTEPRGSKRIICVPKEPVLNSENGLRTEEPSSRKTQALQLEANAQQLEANGQERAYIMRTLKKMLGKQTRRLASLVAMRLVKVASVEHTGQKQLGSLVQALQARPEVVAGLEPLLGDVTAVAQDLEGVCVDSIPLFYHMEVFDQQDPSDDAISAAVSKLLQDDLLQELRNDSNLQTAIRVLDNYAALKKHWNKG
eukprot:jgi/Chrzof1/9055/Cz03g34130.t1